MSEHETPNSIDRRLRNVALPSGLLPRLREIAAMGDVELDFLIRTVPVPEGTLDRLRTIGSLSDADVDGELRDVELPRGMQHRIERAVRWETRRARLIGWAVAASLLAIVTEVAYWSSSDRKVAETTTPIGRSLADQEVRSVHRGPVANSNGSHANPSAIAGQQAVDPAPKAPGSGRTAPRIAESVSPKSPTQLPLDQSHGGTDGNSRGAEADLSNVAKSGPLPDVSARPADSQAIADATLIGQQSIFGGPIAEVPPNLRLVQEPMARGVSGPRVAGYDLLSELRWGRHPFVVPSSNAALRQSRAPIWTSTASYELACRLVAHGQLPPSAQVHAEDFLAAVDYGFPLPTKGPLGIRTAAGPAPWGPPGMGLMQIGIQAAKMPKDAAHETHLTLVLDASAAMRESGRADLVRRALVQLADEVGPRDRVSIVAFSSAARWLLRDGDQASMRRVLATWNDSQWGDWPASGSSETYLALDGLADMAAGIELAVGSPQPADSALGASKPNDRADEKVVLVADSLQPIEERSLPRLRDLLRKAVDGGAKWEMIGLAQDAPLSPQWDDLAAIGGHAVRHANTPDELFERLNESLAGRSQMVAASVEMKVVFDPAAVSRYRLIGHEIGGNGLSGAPLQEDLRSGQAATALYEVELKPDGPTEVAFVEVSWRDPIGDAPHHIRQPISRLQFVSTWRECALPLQAAAVAAEAADVLRNSNVLPVNAHVLDQVAELAEEMNPALANRPSIMRLVQLIEQARTAHPGRSRGTAGGL